MNYILQSCAAGSATDILRPCSRGRLESSEQIAQISSEWLQDSMWLLLLNRAPLQSKFGLEQRQLNSCSRFDTTVSLDRALRIEGWL
jgi:hypothetical protein